MKSETEHTGQLAETAVDLISKFRHILKTPPAEPGIDSRFPQDEPTRPTSAKPDSSDSSSLYQQSTTSGNENFSQGIIPDFDDNTGVPGVEVDVTVDTRSSIVQTLVKPKPRK